MSGPLVGLVREHGPADHYEWAVLTALAERLRGPFRTHDVTIADLAADTRLSVSTVRRAVVRLVAGGWVHRVPGRHTGVASTYRIRLEAFPAEAVEKVAERVSTGHPVTESDDSQEGVHGTPSQAERVSTGRKRVSVGHPTRIRTNTVTTTARESDGLLPVLVGVSGGGANGTHNQTPKPDPARDALAVVLAEVPGHLWPNPSKRVRQALTNALDRGLSAEGLAELWTKRNGGRDYGDLGPGWVVTELETVCAAPAPSRRVVAKVPWCHHCYADNHRWRQDENGNPYPCPECSPQVQRNGTSRPIDQTPTDHPGNERRLDEAPPASGSPFQRITQGDKRHMMTGVGRRRT